MSFFWGWRGIPSLTEEKKNVMISVTENMNIARVEQIIQKLLIIVQVIREGSPRRVTDESAFTRRLWIVCQWRINSPLFMCAKCWPHDAPPTFRSPLERFGKGKSDALVVNRCTSVPVCLFSLDVDCWNSPYSFILAFSVLSISLLVCLLGWFPTCLVRQTRLRKNQQNLKVKNF